LNLRHSVRQLLGGKDVKISDTARGEDAIALLRENQFDWYYSLISIDRYAALSF